MQYELIILFAKQLNNYLEYFMNKIYPCVQKQFFWETAPGIAEIHIRPEWMHFDRHYTFSANVL